MRKIIVFVILVIYSCDLENTNYPVTACFTYEPTENVAGEVKFTNCSSNATDYLWDFGDGKTSTEKNPVYQFQKLFPYKVTLKAYNEEYSDTVSEDVSDVILIKKPNIYLYPNREMDICVNIFFPKGGKVVKSIPEYGDRWCVNIDSNGKIDGKYDYLFYESEQPNLFQHKKGWCVKQEDLKTFFKQNMQLYNFSENEINDFLEYWIPLMNKSEYYNIYPQTKEIIEKTNILKISIKSDYLFRLFYSIEESKRFNKIINPEIKPIIRKGFYVVEWGVMGI